MLGHHSAVAILAVCRLLVVGSILTFLLLHRVDGAAQPVPACPTCEAHPGVEAAKASEDHPREAASTLDCGAEPRPLTSVEKRDFDLARLQAFLGKPQKIEAHAQESTRRTPAVGPSDVTIEVIFQLGELSYHKATKNLEQCEDTVRAPMRVQVRAGDGLLRFEGDGVLWKRRSDVSAVFSAEANLSTVAGSFAPGVDESRVHAFAIELSMYVAPNQLRGSMVPSVIYFADEAQRQRRLEGHRWAYREQRWWAGWAFPTDACDKYALPFEHDEPIVQLHGKSADDMRARAAALIAAAGPVDGVWRDDRETQLAVELGNAIEGTVCLQSLRFTGDWTAPRSALALRIPVAARLRSADARIDMPLDRLLLSVDGNAIIGATLRGWIPIERLGDQQRAALDGDLDLLDALVVYDLSRPLGRFSGIVNFQKEDEPQHYRWTNCLVFPPGSKLDLEQCRYRR
jgi:hypothetical protein